MRVLAVVHQGDAGPGVFAEEARERGVELEEWMLSEAGSGPPREIAEYDAVMTFGGSMHADQEELHPWLRFEREFLAAILEDGMPILAVCLGCQLLAEAAGGSVRRASEPEIGWYRVSVHPEASGDPLLGQWALPPGARAVVSPGFEAFEWHSYTAIPPKDAVCLASSGAGPQAFRIGERAWGIQFHAEVSAADLAHWIEDYETDEDAVRIGVDPERLWAETEPRVEEWNRLGRELCGRFLDAAA